MQLLAYRVKYMIKRHSDVERYCGSVVMGGNCAAVILRHDNPLDPVFVGMLVLGAFALIAVSIFRSHSQVSCCFSAPLRASFPLRLVGVEWRETDVVDDVMRRDVRVVGMTEVPGCCDSLQWQRGRKPDFRVGRRQYADGHGDDQISLQPEQ